MPRQQHVFFNQNISELKKTVAFRSFSCVQVFAPLGAFVCTSDILRFCTRCRSFHLGSALWDVGCGPRGPLPRWGQRVSRGRAELSDVMGMQQGYLRSSCPHLKPAIQSGSSGYKIRGYAACREKCAVELCRTRLGN
jgi:hypothetical protein